MGVAFRVWRHTIPEGVSLEPLDRFVGRDGTPITASMVSSIDLALFDVPVLARVYSEAGILPGNGSSGPIFDVLQTDGRWTKSEGQLPIDRRGYNFRRLITQTQLGNTVPAVAFKSGSVYRLEITVHTGNFWQDLLSVHEYTIEGVYSRT